ncbi:MAG: TSUP family transporter [Pseudomonadota bacterium]
MPDALTAALATNGLIYIALTYLVAGVVRGFTGFGTALIVVPVAGIFLSPAEIILMIGVTGILSNILLFPEAWGKADRGEVGITALAACIGVPIGVALLGRVDPLAVRWVVAVAAFCTLVAVISGWQWRGRLAVPGLTGIGLSAGVLGGMTALSGPILIIFYLANARKPEAVRANMILFLGSLDVLLIANIWIAGTATWKIIWVGLIVSVPYLFSIRLGQALFDPARETAYRAAAYAVVAGALLTGLPLWE